MAMKYLIYLAIAGNILYILWVTYNGIDEGFSGSPVQMISYIGLMALLILNITLLAKRNR
jgi:DMSO/TMAO reductase YedYZ heme-binding membrane subunit